MVKFGCPEFCGTILIGINLIESGEVISRIINRNVNNTMNFFYRVFLKTFARKSYRRVKLEKKSRESFEKNSQEFLDRARELRIDFPPEGKPGYSFKHSGNAGDIIYSLPALYALADGAETDFYLNLDQPANFSIVRGRHPLSGVMLNREMFSMLRPLLLAQPEITRCEVYDGQCVDYDLDVFRKSALSLSSGNIARWYFLHFAVNADLGKPWLRARPNHAVSDYVVIARSQGYHSPGIDYSFLHKYGKLMFVGLAEEFRAMRKALPALEYHPVSDFLELAGVIAGCRFFIGNQSFPFSIAEALKVRRVLEVCHHCPNVIVEGCNGYDFCYQAQFERIVDKLARQCDVGEAFPESGIQPCSTGNTEISLN